MHDRRILLLQAHSDGICGWGEGTATEGPFFISETIDTTWMMLRDFLIPRVLGKEIGSARDVPELLKPIRGNEMAKAALECAVWHLESLARGLPLHQGKDIEVLREVRRLFPNIKLSVDANSAYCLADADHLKQFDALNLLMMEQPLEWDDMYNHARLQAQIATPLCLDESIHHLRHAQAAVEMGACRVVNIKLGRVGGHVEASRIQDYCARVGVPVWCGGMMEAGIGRAHNIAMSTQPGFIWPGDVSASQRYWDEDIIEPEVQVTAQGTIHVPQTPGLGYEIRERRIRNLTVRHESFSALPESVAVS
jgi:O-succinylbenzoate synthase